MLNHTRVATTVDVVRVARAVAAPGIDPRPWQSYAVVDAVGIDSEGVFVDVTLLPSEHPATARVGAEYAGPGFGFYVPIGVDDEIMVAAPDGDPQHGMVVVRRMFSASDNLPQEAIDNPSDLVLVVKSGQSLRIGVSGAGKVYLGDVAASNPALDTVDGSDFMAALGYAIAQAALLTPPAVSAAAIATLETLQSALQALPLLNPTSSPQVATPNVGKAWPVGAGKVNVS